MSETLAPTLPEHVYRGITVSVDKFDATVAPHDFVPHEPAIIDEQGRPTVADGNEYGVYTSTNDQVAKSAYARPKHGDSLPGSPTFTTFQGDNHAKVKMPQIGIDYRISTEGVDFRRPFIASHLNGHYNNGFGGEEYIADSIPAKNIALNGLRIGADLLHSAKEYPFETGNHDEALQALKADIAERSGKLALASQIIGDMPEAHRRNYYVVERAIAHLKAPDKLT